jgi:hypothetical protein
MATQEWYMSMGGAMARRNHALTMVSKWQEKAAEAEADIQRLAAQEQLNLEQATEPQTQEQ